MDQANKVAQFGAPIALPADQHGEMWQRQNKAWWEQNPMRYDWNGDLGVEEFSPDFFREIDRRFFSDASRYLPFSQQPFDRLIPFVLLPELDVLEIGVGNGSHAQLIAARAKSYTGIDLTEYATRNTQRRFEVFGLEGSIRRMDAEQMEFADASFDFIWTWGVIHHSANTKQILSEMHRVLRPGGKAIVMVYHRSFFYYYVFNALFRGVFAGGFLKARSIHELIQCHVDGAIARFYSPSEWIALTTTSGFRVEDLKVMGQKSELFPLPAGRLKDALMSATPNRACRFVTNSLRQGTFLISTLTRTE